MAPRRRFARSRRSPHAAPSSPRAQPPKRACRPQGRGFGSARSAYACLGSTPRRAAVNAGSRCHATPVFSAPPASGPRTQLHARPENRVPYRGRVDAVPLANLGERPTFSVGRAGLVYASIDDAASGLGSELGEVGHHCSSADVEYRSRVVDRSRPARRPRDRVFGFTDTRFGAHAEYLHHRKGRGCGIDPGRLGLRGHRASDRRLALRAAVAPWPAIVGVRPGC